MTEGDLQYDTVGERFCLSSGKFEEVLFELYGEEEVKKILSQQSPNQEEKSPYPEVTTLQFLRTQMELMDQTLGRIYSSIDAQHIGKGGTATVVFVADQGLHQRALKIYRPEKSLEPAQLSCIQRECRAAQQLRSNPHFVPLRRLYKAPEQGIRFRDEQGKVCRLDAATMGAISGDFDSDDSARRTVMEMDRIPGHELGNVRRILTALQEGNLRRAQELCQAGLFLFDADDRESLRHHLGNGSPPEECETRIQKIYTRAVVRVVAQAAGYVQELHDEGFYHTDLKPESFMINAQGLVMHDLGSAIERASEQPVFFLFSPDYVDFSFFDGSLGRTETIDDGAYMYPQKYLPGDDVYLLGGALYNLLTGNYRSSYSYIPAGEKNKAVNPLLEAIMKKSLTSSDGIPHQADRYQTAAEFQFALECSLALQQYEGFQKFVGEKMTQTLSQGEREVRDRLPEAQLSMADFRQQLASVQKQLPQTPAETCLPLVDQLYRLLLVARSESESHAAPRDDGQTFEEALDMLDQE